MFNKSQLSGLRFQSNKRSNKSHAVGVVSVNSWCIISCMSALQRADPPCVYQQPKVGKSKRPTLIVKAAKIVYRASDVGRRPGGYVRQYKKMSRDVVEKIIKAGKYVLSEVTSKIVSGMSYHEAK